MKGKLSGFPEKSSACEKKLTYGIGLCQEGTIVITTMGCGFSDTSTAVRDVASPQPNSNVNAFIFGRTGERVRYLKLIELYFCHIEVSKLACIKTYFSRFYTESNSLKAKTDILHVTHPPRTFVCIKLNPFLSRVALDCANSVNLTSNNLEHE